MSEVLQFITAWASMILRPPVGRQFIARGPCWQRQLGPSEQRVVERKTKIISALRMSPPGWDSAHKSWWQCSQNLWGLSWEPNSQWQSKQGLKQWWPNVQPYFTMTMVLSCIQSEFIFFIAHVLPPKVVVLFIEFLIHWLYINMLRGLEVGK